jgi:hypothetical protein
MSVDLNGAQTMRGSSKGRPGLQRAYTNTISSQEDIMRRFLAFSLSLSMALTPMLSVRAADYPVLEPDINAPQANNRRFSVGVVRLEQGTAVPVAAPANSAQYLDPGKDANSSLVISQDVLDNRGNIVLPKGSEVRGRFAPVPGGLKFLADGVLINGQYLSLRASSDMIPDEKDPREYSGGAIAGDAGIGAAGGALLSAIAGGVTWGAVLGGAAAGVLVGNVTAPRVVVVRPDRSINLSLDAPVVIRR